MGSQVNLHRLVSTLESIQRHGGRIWVENDQVRYRVPKGVLTPTELEELRANTRQIVSFLRRPSESNSSDTLSPSLQGFNCAPLTFNQLAHWNSSRLGTRSSLREVVSLTRLRGNIALDKFEASLELVIRRHDALRTRFIDFSGSPTQQISDSHRCDFAVESLVSLEKQQQEARLERIIREQVLKPVDVSRDPLFALRLITLGKEDHLLLISMDHLISDEWSMAIVLKDLMAVYSSALNADPPPLPAVPVQLPDYALWQRRTLSSWKKRNDLYWQQHLLSAIPRRFPADISGSVEMPIRWMSIPFSIPSQSRAKLLEWSRENRTTLAMSAFTAYVALLLLWCGEPETIIQYQTTGRPTPELAHTIGYFASPIYVRASMRDTDTFKDLLDRVVNAYSTAHNHADFAYLMCEHREFSLGRCSMFNWVPDGTHESAIGESTAVEMCPVSFSNPALEEFSSDRDPVLLLFDRRVEITGRILFSGESNLS